MSISATDTTDGPALAEQGMETVLAKEPDAWVDCVTRRILSFPREHRFTMEEIEAVCGKPIRHPNAAGAVLHHLAKQRLIVWAGEMKHSKKPSRRNGLVRVWVRQ